MNPKITFRQWMDGTIEQRAAWLADGTELDEPSRHVMNQWLLWQECGAIISEDSAIAYYDEYCPTAEIAA